MIQGDSSSSEMITGIVVVAVALPLFYFIGGMIGRMKNRRFERAWRPLMSSIDGAEVVADNGGGASSWLTGTYRGTPVFAQMTPDVRHGGAIQTSGLENRWEAGVRELPGKHDWSVVWSQAVFGFGETGWTVRTDDPALGARLENAGVREIAASLGRGAIRYGARPQTLVLHEDIRPLWTPDAARFQQELDVLLELAAVAAPLNQR